jgi:hypothetical protein
MRNLARDGKVPALISQVGSRRVYSFPTAEFAEWLDSRATRTRASTVVDLRAEVRALQEALVQERTGRLLAEKEIDRLRRELAKRVRALAVLNEDEEDPSEATARFARDKAL